MRLLFTLSLLAALLVLTLAACSGNPDYSAVRGTVGTFEQTLENVIAGEAPATALDEFFATPAEGANKQGLVNTRDAFRRMVEDHVGGASLVQLSNFRITDVQVHHRGGLAKVTYQVDLKIIHGTQQATGTKTQDLALLRTLRGWRISGGDPWRYSNIVGALP